MPLLLLTAAGVAVSVAEILELFAHPSEALKLAVQQQIDLFNPNDPCWTVSPLVPLITGELRTDYMISDSC